MHSAVIGPFIRFGATPTIVFIATLGMSFMIQNTLVIFFGAANVAYTLDPGAPQHIGPFLLTPLDLEIIASAIAITVALYLVISRTRFGKTLRAVSQNRALPRATAINATLVAPPTFFLAAPTAAHPRSLPAHSTRAFHPYFG